MLEGPTITSLLVVGFVLVDPVDYMSIKFSGGCLRWTPSITTRGEPDSRQIFTGSPLSIYKRFHTAEGHVCAVIDVSFESKTGAKRLAHRWRKRLRKNPSDGFHHGFGSPFHREITAAKQLPGRTC